MIGFSFLAPVFLIGAAAIAIPVLVHLTHRQSKDAVRFPSLMFLAKIPYRARRRQRIRHWPLFLMRSLALALLVAAFARPLLEDVAASAGALVSARELVILLDRSHSMAYGNRWERALAEGREIVGGMGADDRATLVLFGERAAAVSQSTSDRAALLAALDAAELGYEATRYGPALQLAREIVERADRPRKEVVLISDLQRTGWDDQQVIGLPEGAELTVVDLSEKEALNLSIASATATRSRTADREQAAVTAAVNNHGTAAIEGLSVRLLVDGQEVGVEKISLAPRSSGRVRFEPFNLPGRPLSGVVRAGDDALPEDNEFRFVIAKSDPVSVLMVGSGARSGTGNLYLRRALEIGTEPGFRLTERSLSQLTLADLGEQRVVILNDVSYPAGTLGRRLGEFVGNGGGLLMVLGRRSRPEGWPTEGLTLLPAKIGGTTDRSAMGGGTLSYVDYDHPGLELFQAPRSGDFSAARFFRYHRLELKDSARALASFDDRAALLAEMRHGQGTVIVWASGLENFWNDLPLQPVFLPLIQQLVNYLARYVEPRSWYRVGEVLDLSDGSLGGGAALSAAAELVVRRPSGERVLLRPERESHYLALDKPGFHEVRVAGGSGEPALTVAVNMDPLESDLAALDLEEIVGTLTYEGGESAGTPSPVQLSAEERERRQGLWWYLLVGAGILLLSETYVSNRLSRAGR
ncbi:MAG: BatA domain-containing protein [Gemmatimonadota bacterium]|nr:MAG: BatA domain-containing protein [Gemmatimonadota bacterium]